MRLRSDSPQLIRNLSAWFRLPAAVCGVAAVLAVLWYVLPAIRSLLTVEERPVRADAIVLLAGIYRERAPTAARLFHEGGAPRIILTNDGVFSSWSQQYQRNLYNVEWAKELLVSLGVPSHAIVQLPFTRSGTFYDATAVRTYCRQNGAHALLLVTSDYHTRRALWTFRRLFRREPVAIGIVPVPSGTPGWFHDRWRICRDLLSEAVKWGYYVVRLGLSGDCG